MICWSADLKSKTTEDIISIRSFIEVLALNHYVLVRKILIMSSITAQQAKLDLELVPIEKRLEIRKCNGRLNPGKIQREPTFQVVLDALALTSCYSAFLITADVTEVYMHQFWDSVYKHDTFYRFKMDKRKRFKLNLEIFRDIFKICPRLQGQDFDALPTDEEIVFFLRELGHTREIKSLNDVVVDQTHQPWRTFAALINRILSGKTTVSPEKPTGKSKKVKRPAKKSTKAPARGVVIRETLEMPLSKKKEKMTLEKCKGIDLLSEVALTEEAQYEEARRKSMRDFHKTHPRVSGTVAKTAPIQLYDDVDIRLNEPVDTDKGFVQEEGTDAAMTNVQQGNENPEILQVIEDAHVTFSTVPQKTEVLMHKLFLQWMFTSIMKVTTLEKEVAELKKDPLYTQVTALVDDHLDARLGATKDEFMNRLFASITARVTGQVKIQLP
ncbi:hypothetical protein Tco_0374111 [Tanacetum coccineum]